MNTYTVQKKMQSTFDFGYEATVDLTNQHVKAHVYDSEDWDNLVMSFIVCDMPQVNTVVIYATGVVCRRSTCFGDKIIGSFDEGHMGVRILRELADVFKEVYPAGEFRLYSHEEFQTVCQKARDIALDASCVLAHTALPKNAVIDIAKGSLPSWTEYTHDPLATSEKLRALFVEAYGSLEVDIECDIETDNNDEDLEEAQ